MAYASLRECPTNAPTHVANWASLASSSLSDNILRDFFRLSNAIGTNAFLSSSPSCFQLPARNMLIAKHVIHLSDLSAISDSTAWSNNFWSGTAMCLAITKLCNADNEDTEIIISQSTRYEDHNISIICIWVITDAEDLCIEPGKPDRRFCSPPYLPRHLLLCKR